MKVILTFQVDSSAQETEFDLAELNLTGNEPDGEIKDTVVRAFSEKSGVNLDPRGYLVKRDEDVIQIVPSFEFGIDAIHPEPSEYAGKTVRIKDDAWHPQFPSFGGSEFTVVDWWDRVTGKSWKDSDHNPACFIYSLRRGLSNLPFDDEVLYGKTDDGSDHLVHITEIIPETLEQEEKNESARS